LIIGFQNRKYNKKLFDFYGEMGDHVRNHVMVDLLSKFGNLSSLGGFQN